MHERSLKLPTEVSRKLGELLVDKEAVIRVMDGLRAAHRIQFAGYRANRDEANPDTQFSVPVPILLRGRMRLIRFSVNDTISPDDFLVWDVSMSA